MYSELRKEGKRDAQHCMPVKQIPDLNWKKEPRKGKHRTRHKNKNRK